MNFGMIFVILLVGAVIGFEFGRYTESRRIRDAMKKVRDGIAEASERLQKLADEQKKHDDAIPQTGDSDKLGAIDLDDILRYRTDKPSWARDIVFLDKQKELEFCRELITSMTAKGATGHEMASVVRYSMVVIDAQKLRLDWKKAKVCEGIMDLKTKYMDGNDIFAGGDVDGDADIAPIMSAKDYNEEIKEAIQDGKGA